MRPVLLCIFLVIGSAISASAQQPKEITNSIGMKLVLIPPGSFNMGSPDAERGNWGMDETLHNVTLTKFYYLGVYEVTQLEYEKVMGENRSYFRGQNKPVERVNWYDAVSFCKKLSEMPEEETSQRKYRLPTEAEWEYACRAGSTSQYGFVDRKESLAEYAWFSENSDRMTHPVGAKKPNRFGLYDMHGNVFEWCVDFYGPYPSGLAIDPQGLSESPNRVARGGSWASVDHTCRSALRDWELSTERISINGFRVAMSLPVKQPEASSSK